MTLAIIADIHANLPALKTVLADIKNRYGNIPIHCLGDIVDYGPQPKECLDLVLSSCKTVLAGNHEADISDPGRSDFGKFGDWTHERLSNDDFAAMRMLPYQIQEGYFVAAHAMPHPGDDSYKINNWRIFTYVHPIVATWPECVERINHHLVNLYASTRSCHVAVIGHVHRQYAFLQGSLCENIDGLVQVPRLAGIPTLVCVPSVGQPRDNDPRTGYAVLKDHIIEFVRINYDIESTVEELRKRGCPEQETMMRILRTGSLKKVTVSSDEAATNC